MMTYWADTDATEAKQRLAAESYDAAFKRAMVFAYPDMVRQYFGKKIRANTKKKAAKARRAERDILLIATPNADPILKLDLPSAKLWELLHLLSAKFDVSPGQIISKSRVKRSVAARHELFSLLVRQGYTPTAISAATGFDRTTVLYGAGRHDRNAQDLRKNNGRKAART